MRKILTKAEKNEKLANFYVWFDVLDEDDTRIIFTDKIKNKIIYYKTSRTRLFFFKLVDESLIKYPNKSFTFYSVVKKFKEYNIQVK